MNSKPHHNSLQQETWGVLRSATCRASGVRRHALPFVLVADGARRIGGGALGEPVRRSREGRRA
ncbi:MAG: hypothetical protein H7Z38_21565 [Rubrivivax sp.]|nr:hypothetical protein [Pyrinomonadaceae bacterium]